MKAKPFAFPSPTRQSARKNPVPRKKRKADTTAHKKKAVKQKVARVKVGTKFSKEFGGDGMFVGTVNGYDGERDLYSVSYDDGDFEELSWRDLRKLTLPRFSNYTT